MPKLLITCRQMQMELPVHRARLEGLGYELIVPELGSRQQFSADELGTMTDGVVGMIAGDDELNGEFFSAAQDLRVLIRWGIGMDSVDHDAARQHGVTVRNTPGVFGREVADSAFAYILLLARGHHEVDRRIRGGEWPKYEGITLGECTLGVVGFGAIGREVAARGRGFGMDVVVSDPVISTESLPPGVRLADVDTVFREARFLVLACPLNDVTLHLVNADRLAIMRNDSYLINVARGPVVDERALTEALLRGTIAGAGLDVFEVEPLPAQSPIRTLPNVLLGAHNGSNTREGVRVASQAAVDFLLAEVAR